MKSLQWVPSAWYNEVKILLYLYCKCIVDDYRYDFQAKMLHCCTDTDQNLFDIISFQLLFPNLTSIYYGLGLF